MSVSLFVTLLTIFSTVTGVATEAVKKLLNENNVKYATNSLAFIIACIVGISGTAIYYVLYSVAFTPINIVFMFLMGIATSMGAMVGYDKVIQTVKQLKTAK